MNFSLRVCIDLRWYFQNYPNNFIQYGDHFFLLYRDNIIYLYLITYSKARLQIYYCRVLALWLIGHKNNKYMDPLFKCHSKDIIAHPGEQSRSIFYITYFNLFLQQINFYHPRTWKTFFRIYYKWSIYDRTREMLAETVWNCVPRL